jgi:hypothetical protein
MSRIKASAVVSRQLPEFVREDYPTFVAFVEAYYEYLQAQGVDFNNIRDIDKTIEQFIDEFKKELAYNAPPNIADDRFILQRIKDYYLAKGSEASYKLFFKLLFGKTVDIVYPGQQLLKASDGLWKQETSIFVRVVFGDPDSIIGREVDIQSGNLTFRVLVDRKEELTRELDKVASIDPSLQIYEFFLDRSFFGEIKPGDTVRFGDNFLAIILPTTSAIKISQGGRNFRIGQVFELVSGAGTTILIKVTEVTPTGGIKYADIIKFGIGYTANFASSLLAETSIGTRAVVSSEQAGTLSSLSQNPDPGNPGAFIYSSGIGDRTIGFDELGYINFTDYVDSEYLDGAYVGSLITQFSLNFRNAQSSAEDPAIISVNTGSLARYPGFFENNNGFLSDSIFVQDSKYYQTFSYVTRIDERLNSYKSALKTMLHPAGLELFGEYNITTTYDLGQQLISVASSLGIRLDDLLLTQSDITSTHITKILSTNQGSIDTLLYNFNKQLINNVSIEDIAFVIVVTSLLSLVESVEDSTFVIENEKSLSSLIDVLENVNFEIDTHLFTSVLVEENASILSTRSLSSDIGEVEDDDIGLLLSKPISSNILEVNDANIDLFKFIDVRVASEQSLIDEDDFINIQKSLQSNIGVEENVTVEFLISLSTTSNIEDDSTLLVEPSLSSDITNISDDIITTFGPNLSSLVDPEDNNIIFNIESSLFSELFVEEEINIEFIVELSSVLNEPQDITNLQFGALLSSSLANVEDDVIIFGIDQTISTIKTDLGAPEDNEVTLDIDTILTTTFEIEDLVTVEFLIEVSSELGNQDDAIVLDFGLGASSVLSIAEDELLTFNVNSTLSSTLVPQLDNITAIDTNTILTTNLTEQSENLSFETAKYVDSVLNDQSNEGYLQFNSYYDQDYIILEDDYSVGSRQSTFNTP